MVKEKINQIERPLDLLNQSKGKKVLVFLKGDKTISGTLIAFDIHINLVLENSKNVQDSKSLGLMFIRGDTIEYVSLGDE